MTSLCVVLLSLVGRAAGHGAMTQPIARTGMDTAPIMDLRHSGCTMEHDRQHTVADHQRSPCYNHMQWFCGKIASPVPCLTPPLPWSVPAEYWSSPPGFIYPDPFQTTPIPWRAAGSSVPASPCGIHDPDKADGKQKPKTPIGALGTVWHRGQTVSVGHSIAANHGGGYSWRLCPDSVFETASPTEAEDCFREHPLEFSDDKHLVKWSNGTNVTIPALQTNTGTTPAGSWWRRNPIPSLEYCAITACKCPTGWTAPCPAFQPPCPGCWGGVVDQMNGKSNSHHEDFSVLDNVRVPDLPEGSYVLQWRWDTETLPDYQQVWTNCADIQILASREPSMLV